MVYLLVGNVVNAGAQIVQLAVVLVLLLLSPGWNIDNRVEICGVSLGGYSLFGEYAERIAERRRSESEMELETEIVDVVP